MSQTSIARSDGDWTMDKSNHPVWLFWSRLRRTILKSRLFSILHNASRNWSVMGRKKWQLNWSNSPQLEFVVAELRLGNEINWQRGRDEERAIWRSSVFIAFWFYWASLLCICYAFANLLIFEAVLRVISISVTTNAQVDNRNEK